MHIINVLIKIIRTDLFECFIFFFNHTFPTLYCTFLVKKQNKHALFFIVLSQKSHYYVYSSFFTFTKCNIQMEN